jgi:hypothetical protein
MTYMLEGIVWRTPQVTWRLQELDKEDQTKTLCWVHLGRHESFFSD